MKTDVFLRIDDYLLNRLSDQERIEFEKAILVDSNLKDEFKFRLALKRVIDEKEEKRIRQELRNINAGMEPYNKFSISISKYRKWIVITSVAASLSLLFIAYFQIYLAKSNYKYLSSFYSAPHNYYMPTLRSANQNNKFAEIIEGMHYYDIQKYEEALEKLQTAYENDKTNENLMFYLASSNLLLNNISEAKEIFIKLKNSGNMFYKKHVDWSLSLIYLEEGDIEKAKSLLIRIKNSNNSFSEKASQLLLEIKNKSSSF